jgi:ABC-2 type transport system ATP-binding protein
MPAALSFEAVTKSYGRRRVLDEVSFVADAGETIAVLGANGAGKTTLVKSLLDLIAPDSGTIRIFGISAAFPESRRPLAFLPERFTPPRHLSGRQFLDLWFALLKARPSPERVARTVMALDLAPDALDRPVADLSKGMAQKLGLAGLLACDKDLAVADEPMSGLDPQTRAAVAALLATRRSAAQTTLFSTHLIADVPGLADKVAVLDHGRLAFFGSPQDLMDQTARHDLESAFLALVAA